MATLREWAEVPFVPSRRYEHRDAEPYRYLALRIRPPQGTLFGDGAEARHFAIVTNDQDTPGGELLVWHRGKQGTIEHAHRTLKDELGAGVYPSAKHGANAAWLRLQVLTLDLLELLKAVALDADLRRARPKRLRFRVFTALRAGRRPCPGELHPRGGRPARRPAPPGPAEARPRGLAAGRLTGHHRAAHPGWSHASPRLVRALDDAEGRPSTSSVSRMAVHQAPAPSGSLSISVPAHDHGSPTGLGFAGDGRERRHSR